MDCDIVQSRTLGIPGREILITILYLGSDSLYLPVCVGAYADIYADIGYGCELEPGRAMQAMISGGQLVFRSGPRLAEEKLV